MAETRSETARAEATRDPIFLFQVRRWHVLGAPDGYEFGDEGDCFAVDEKAEGLTGEDGEPERTELTPQDLAARTFGEFDTPCAIETWQTDGVFLSREEGEAWGRARDYRFKHGWRVFCVPAEGALAKVLSEDA